MFVKVSRSKQDTVEHLQSLFETMTRTTKLAIVISAYRIANGHVTLFNVLS